jgi:peroxiredoxin
MPLKPGDTAPEFALLDKEGSEVSLGDFTSFSTTTISCCGERAEIVDLLTKTRAPVPSSA